MINLNPTDKIFSGFYCARCLDDCPGFRRFAGKVCCDKCGDEMIEANDPSEWAVFLETEALRAIGERILVLEDEFKSGYECKDCDGKGHTDVVCKFCKGRRTYKGLDDGGSCPDCEVGTSDGRKSFGYELCPTCKGQQARVIIPDSAKRRPLTGRILSIGRKVTEFKVGDRVMYTNYTGTDFEIKGGIKVRIMLQHDVMCEHKRLNKSMASPSSGIINKELSNVGVI
jgi:co-chaperonin GroES (HSP10)